MAIGAVYDSGNYSFGSLASIRRQADAIKKRAGAERESRMAEQDRTGLIRNPDTGEMVQLSSVSEETRERWNDREDMAALSIGDVMILFKAADPNAEEVEASQARGARFAKIQDKMLAGKKITGEEMRFLQENYPPMAALAKRMEREAEQLEKCLQRSKTAEGKYQAYVEAKMRIMSGAGKDDGSILFLSAALDAAYAKRGKHGEPTGAIDTYV